MSNKHKCWVQFSFKVIDPSRSDYGVLFDRKIKFNTLAGARHFANTVASDERARVVGLPVIHIAG